MLPVLHALSDEAQARCLARTTPELTGRQQIAGLVLECCQAIQRGELRNYVQPIPVTRLNRAQRAFREIGAIRTANILRSNARNTW